MSTIGLSWAFVNFAIDKRRYEWFRSEGVSGGLREGPLGGRWGREEGTEGLLGAGSGGGGDVAGVFPGREVEAGSAVAPGAAEGLKLLAELQIFLRVKVPPGLSGRV